MGVIHQLPALQSTPPTYPQGLGVKARQGHEEACLALPQMPVPCPQLRRQLGGFMEWNTYDDPIPQDLEGQPGPSALVMAHTQDMGTRYLNIDPTMQIHDPTGPLMQQNSQDLGYLTIPIPADSNVRTGLNYNQSWPATPSDYLGRTVYTHPRIAP